MSTLLEIEAAVETLPEAEKRALLEFISAKLEARTATPAKRIAGLHGGAWEVGPDFDAPLPEEFWLGHDA